MILSGIVEKCAFCAGFIAGIALIPFRLLSRRTWMSVLFLMLIPQMLPAQCDVSYVEALRDTSSQQDDPRVRRSRGLAIQKWGAITYLVENVGDDQLYWWDLTDPANPDEGSRTRFAYHPFGDRDFNLFNFSVCDDCRYATAGFDMMGTELVDLGTGQTPIPSSHYYPDAPGVGNCVFKRGAYHYAVLTLDGSHEKLYKITGINPGEQIEMATFNHDVDGCIDLGSHIWLVGGGYVRSYAVVGPDDNPSLVLASATLRATVNLGWSVAVDGDRAVTVLGPQTLKVWDISNPGTPALLGEFDSNPQPGFNTNSVALADGRLLAAVTYATSTGATATWDVSDIQHPAQIDQPHWEGSQTWNSTPRLGNVGAVWYEGSLYFSRWSQLQRHEIRCSLPALIFQDGFESGSTSAWGEVK